MKSITITFSKNKTKIFLLVLVVILVLISAGCLTGDSTEKTQSTSTSTLTTAPAKTTSVVSEEMHEEGEEPHEEEEGHGVPHEFQDMMNPISATEESITKGQGLYVSKCVACHGTDGYGDGQRAESMDPRPSNLHDAHVIENKNGGLFYIITYGVDGTPMIPFNNLSDEERWHIVNYLRTFEEEGNGH